MAAETIRVAMIGCGGNARGHMQRLLKIPGVKIVGLCDVSTEAIQAAQALDASLANVPVYHDYQQMLQELDCDAVEISTPHTLHFEQIMAALQAGRHVLCEKPLVCTVEHAQKVIAKIQETGLILGVAYQRHLQPPYRYCRQFIASGEAGSVHFISALQSQNWYRGRMARKDWRSQKVWAGGGQLNDSGSHLLDIILWMTNLQPAEVFAFQENLEAEVDILTAMSVKFAEGALCNISVVGHSVNWLEDITIWGEKATLAIRGNEIWRWRGEQKEIVPPEELEPASDPDANFIAAIRGQDQIQATAEDFLKVIQLSEAAWASAASGQPVAIQRRNG